MVTRRALFGAGALALLAGCGPEEEPKVDAGAVLDEQLDATYAVIDAYDNAPVAGSLRSNAEARVRRLDAAVEPFRGDGPAIAEAGSRVPNTGLEAALAAETAALRSYVAAVGRLEKRQHRELLAGLITDSAASQSALLALLKRPPIPTAFPGQPV